MSETPIDPSLTPEENRLFTEAARKIRIAGKLKRHPLITKTTTQGIPGIKGDLKIKREETKVTIPPQK